ncbi:MAG: heat-inducible transcriptional repressor HrcA [Chroococcales cyanobacterium]
MSLKVNLTKRQQHILWATVRHYVSTAEPVSSKTLTQEYNFQVSSATIRNAMGFLEKGGLLYQPHTSAGRIPSDSGYRIYVDQLMIPDEIVAREIQQRLNQKLNAETWSFEALLQGAAQMLATVSGYIALITMPQNPSVTLRHLQLIYVHERQVMLVIVTDAYQTQSVLMDLSAPKNSQQSWQLSEGELEILSNFLNSKLRGKLLSEITRLDWKVIDKDFQHYADFLKFLFKEVSDRIQSPTSTQIMIRGISEVLRQPEFSQMQQVQMLLHLLEEEQDQLLPLIFEGAEPEIPVKQAKVRIGSENHLESLNSCALVSAIYRQGDIPVGSVGMIGPTRMLYENAIALVESTAHYLTETLS